VYDILPSRPSSPLYSPHFGSNVIKYVKENEKEKEKTYTGVGWTFLIKAILFNSFLRKPATHLAIWGNLKPSKKKI
jgi:hypothetical protein